VRHNAFDFQALSDDVCGQWAATFVRIGVLPPPPPTDRQHVALRGGGTHHIRESRAAQKWAPFMRGSAIDCDKRVARLFKL